MKLSIYPPLFEMEKKAKRFNVLPVFASIPLDLETPVSLFLKTSAYKREYSFLLESVIGGEKRGRFSILGVKPYKIFLFKEGRAYYKKEEEKKWTFFQEGDPFFLLEKFLSSYRIPPREIPGFFGGAVGYFSYDCIYYYEKISQGIPLRDPLGAPEGIFVIPRNILLFDHAWAMVYIISNIFLEEGESLSFLYHQAEEEIAFLYSLLFSSYEIPSLAKEGKGERSWEVNISADEFMEKVEKAKFYIREGDIFIKWFYLVGFLFLIKRILFFYTEALGC